MKVLNVSLLVVLLDQITKLLVKGFSVPFLNITWDGMDYGQSINIVDDLFKLTFVENPGMAFGIDVDGYSKLFLSLFSLVASIGIFIYFYKMKDQKILFRVALALILGGAVGNMIDRFFYGIFFDYAPLFYGKVVDFLHVNTFGFTLFGKTFDSFPIFNIADSAVTIGVAILLIFHKSFEEPKVDENKNLNNSEKELKFVEDGNSNREDYKG